MIKIKKPLSLLIFYKRNLVKLLPFLIIILFSVFTIITLNAFLNSFNDTLNFYMNFGKKSVIITSTDSSQFIDPTPLLIKDKRILDVYEIESVAGQVKLMGYIPYIIIAVSEQDVEKIMKYFGVVIKEGRIFKPNATGEILLSEEIVKNKGLRINEEELKGWKLVGILKGETALGICPYQSKKEKGIWKEKLVTFKEPVNYKDNIKIIEKVQDEYKLKYKCKFLYYSCMG